MPPSDRSHACPASRSHSRNSSAHARDGCSRRIHDYLLNVAKQSQIAEVSFCERVFKHFNGSASIRRALRRELDLLQLTEHEFYALVAIYSFGPRSVSARDMWQFLEGSCIAEVLSELKARAYIVEASQNSGGDTAYMLTEKGRDRTVFTIYRYLRVVTNLSLGEVEPQ